MTLCVALRHPVLASPEAWTACRVACERLDQWKILTALAMPDHIHLLATPIDRNASVSQFAKWFKRWFNQAYQHSKHDMSWKWQEGVFDRLLRSNESVARKWDYIRQNPVRAGLVSDASDWPYQMLFDTL